MADKQLIEILFGRITALETQVGKKDQKINRLEQIVSDKENEASYWYETAKTHYDVIIKLTKEQEEEGEENG